MLREKKRFTEGYGKMKLEAVSTLMFCLLPLGILLVSRLNILSVRASESGIIYIRADGSIDPSDAPISTLDNVTYTLTGNIVYPTYKGTVVSRSNIIIDGNGHTVYGSGNPFMGTTGISARGYNVTIHHVNVAGHSYGMSLCRSENKIFENNITDHYAAIILRESSDHSIYGNNIREASTRLDIGVNVGIYLSSSNNNAIFRNNIDGVWAAGDSTGIRGCISSNNTISGNNITNNFRGIWLQVSSDNDIVGNNITNNGFGIELWGRSRNNSVFHNNFAGNALQIDFLESFEHNAWDNGFEGNYWSNYGGVDLDHDGIGDSPHVLNVENQDNYPLMGMFHSFPTPVDDPVNVISNSVIESFEYSEGNSAIKLVVSNMTADQTMGFCRVCIPKSLMPPPYTVVIDNGATEVQFFNGTVYDTPTHRWIYFAYPHSDHAILIIPGPSTILTLLLMLAALITATVYRTKYSS